MPEPLVWTVRDLRRRWKPAKLRLQAICPEHPTAIRVHRCCSWLQRVEELGESALDDHVLILRWIALNSLYGRWDEQRREPAGDRQMLAQFSDRISQLDGAGHLTEALTRHKPLVLAIMDDEYLMKHFWEEPSVVRAQRTKKAVIDVRRGYAERRFPTILWRLLDRIYLLRCQLVHGAATAGGALNRTALRRCNTMLGHLLPAVVLVVIDFGCDCDWGPLCYPPHSPARLGGR